MHINHCKPNFLDPRLNKDHNFSCKTQVYHLKFCHTPLRGKFWPSPKIEETWTISNNISLVLQKIHG